MSSTDTSTPDDGDTDLGPYCLVMKPYNVCMVCQQNVPDVTDQSYLCFCFERLYGWYYCQACLKSGRLRHVVMAYLTKHRLIPLHSVISKSDTLKFFRYSKRDSDQPVVDAALPLDVIIPVAKIRHGSRLKDGEHMLCMTLEFNDENGTWKRSVSLANLFYHNDGLYEKLVSAESLLPTFQFAFSDLCPELQTTVKEAYLQSKSSENGVFPY